MRCNSSCSNCETDDGEFLTVDVLEGIDVENDKELSNLPVKENNYNEIDSDSSNSPILCNSSPSTNNSNTLSLETCSVTYFAGYLAKKCLDQFSCYDCELNLIVSKTNLYDESLLLLMYKTYDHVDPIQGLKAPSNQLLQIVKICLDVFEKWFPIIKSSKKLIFQLKENANVIINKQFPNFQKTKCINHYTYIIELLFRTKLFKECKWENTKIRSSNIQNAAKLRVLQNQ